MPYQLFNLNLENRYVAFLDVLGFKELVFRDKNEELETYFNTILNALKLIQDKPEIKSLLISDSVILTAPDSVHQFKLLLTAIRTIQCELLKKEIILRGGVSFGEVQYDELNKVIVGKGYIDAYLLESEAIFPRVIIDPKIIAKIGTDRKGFLEQINENNLYNLGTTLIHSQFTQTLFNLPLNPMMDGLLFVDYLNKFADNQEIFELKDLLYNFLSKNFYGNRPNIHKYKWLRLYIIESAFRVYSENVNKNTPEQAELKKRYNDFSNAFDRL